MGVYRNAQVGYTGRAKKVDDFKNNLKQFAADFPGWPQFVASFPYLQPPRPSTTILKFPSPLEVFARLNGAAPPPDLTPVPDPKKWPNSLWPPIATLQTNWITYSSTV